MDEALENMRRQLGMPYEVELENQKEQKDKVKMSPLTVEDYPKIYKIMKSFRNVNPDEPMKLLDEFDDNILGLIKELTVKSLKPNYPGAEDKELQELALKHAFVFMGALVENNIGMGSGEVKEIQKRQALLKLKSTLVKQDVAAADTVNTGKEQAKKA